MKNSCYMAYAPEAVSALEQEIAAEKNRREQERLAEQQRQEQERLALEQQRAEVRAQETPTPSYRHESSEKVPCSYKVSSTSDFSNKFFSEDKFRKIYISCDKWHSNYVTENYDYYNGELDEHYFSANAGAVFLPGKYETLEEAACELCAKGRR